MIQDIGRNGQLDNIFQFADAQLCQHVLGLLRIGADVAVDEITAHFQLS